MGTKKLMAVNAPTSTIHKSEETQNQPHELIAVLLPTYCEAENIRNLIREIQELNLGVIITVVDDSSPDGTSKIVQQLQNTFGNIYFISRQKKLGLGTAITTGFKFFLSLDQPPDYIITMDSDYSHNPNDIVKLVNCARSGNDLVIGSRYVKGGAMKNWPLKRRLISRGANIIAPLVTGKRTKDCTSGFRCYSRGFVEKVLPTLHSTTYEIQIETVRQARLNQFKIHEIPITFVDRKKGKSKLSKDEVCAFLTYTAKSWLANLHLSPKTREQLDNSSSE